MKMLKGSSHTEESKRMISRSKKRQVPWNRGIPRTIEEKVKMSKANKGITNIGRIPWNKGLTKDSDVRVCKCGWSKGLTKETDSRIAKMTRTVRKLWKDPQYAKRVMHRRIPSGEEVVLSKLLVDNGFQYKYVGNGEVWFGGRNPDFINTNDHKKLIELWGDFYHKNQNPQERIDHFKQYGFDTLVIWASELKHSDQVLTKVQRFERDADNDEKTQGT